MRTEVRAPLAPIRFFPAKTGDLNRISETSKCVRLWHENCYASAVLWRRGEQAIR